ncbi:hypothetical protein DPM19_23610 [Actinomadura craniellae]|uniref:Glycosyltransferase n=1 Tax=Actinomadura craniellae TaxID=2231787 RepID=A0A365H0J3_9ACTN|nr:glycosyltransferase [Actinomadura craniellae]RAY12591.1 hypothetical protein DPM19_23610 [Actinomadura craniellae]
MRYLFTTMSASSHLMPLIPLAHAAQAAGHESLVATSGSALRTATASGLIATDVGTRNDVVRPYAELVRKLNETSLGADLSDEEMLGVYGTVFGEVGELMLDELVQVAREWRADAIVYPSIHAAGLLAARIVGVPAILHGYGTPLPTFGPALEYLAPTARKAGIDSLREAEIEIDVCPASLSDFVQLPSEIEQPGHTLPMRYTAFSVGSSLPEWARVPADRPRVVATCGSVTEMSRGGSIYREIVQGTADLDVEVVVLTAGADLPELPTPLPDHVRTVDWISLRALLDTSDVIVHHGGSGTVLTSFVSGLPQIAIPLAGTVNWTNAQTVEARGAGMTLDMAGITAPDVARAVDAALRNPSYRKAGTEVAGEMAALPSPTAIVGRIEELIG